MNKKTNAVAAAVREVELATRKFPTWPTDPLHALAVLQEEVGELTKEVVQLTYEPHKSSPEAVRREAVQTAAMALRFLMSLDRYVFAAGQQHSPNVELCHAQTEHETTNANGVGISDGLGRWFYAEYGVDVVIGQCVARVRNGGYMLRFRWGNPFRTTQRVEASRILGEAQDPRFLSRLAQMFNRPNAKTVPTEGGEK